MGAAGDMLLAALSELTGSPDEVISQLNALSLPGVIVARQSVISCGIRGTQIRVFIDGHEEGGVAHGSHTHGQSFSEIDALLDGLVVSAQVKTDAKQIYRLIADAESKAHGRPVAQVHFHEVGMMDAIVDIVGCCLALEQIAPDCITCSRISVGGGTVQTAHGLLSVPAPATTALLSGLPIIGGPVEAELTTPTGAAILRYFVQKFGFMPAMQIVNTSYGMGTKQFDRPNCVRAFIGKQEINHLETAQNQIVELCCNLDDMTGEAIAFAMETILSAGALDVFCTPIFMKKGRPAQMLTVLCRIIDTDAMAQVLFLHTTTLGVRKMVCNRYVLNRSEQIVETKYGSIRIKTAIGKDIQKNKPEYEDVAHAAREHDVPLATVLSELTY